MRKLIQDLATRVGARFASGAMQALALAMVARAAGPAEFGRFSYVTSIATMCLAVLGFGFGTRALRMGAEENPRSLATTMSILRLGSVSVVCAAIFVLFRGAPQGEAAVVAALGLVAADSLNELEVSILSGERRQRSVATILLFRRATLLCCLAIAGAVGVSLFRTALLTSAALASLSVARAARAWRRPASFVPTIRDSTGYWLADIMSNLGQLDMTVIRLSSGIGAVGLYGAANRLGNPLSMVSHSLISVVIPELAHERDPRRYRKLMRLGRMGAGLYCAVLALLSPVIANVAIAFLGPEYSRARPILIAISVAAGLSGLSQVYQAHLYACGAGRRIAAVLALGTIVTLTLLGALGPNFGMDGLAVALVTGQGVLVLLFAGAARMVHRF